MAPKQSRDDNKRSLPEDFRELRTMPRKDLSSLLRRIKERANGLESFGSSYRKLTDDYHANFDMVVCSEQFAYTAESEKPGAFTLEYADPGLLCQHVLSHCPRLAEKWIRSLQSHPGTAANPWGVVVGYDEFNPGSKFDFDHTKAVMCLYFNFVEIDDASQGSTWFCPVAARVSEISNVVGGWSRVLACILHRMFFGPNGFLTAGCAFTHEDRHYVVFAGLRILMSDGDGLRKGLAWKGANAIRASIIHGNMLKKGSDLARRIPGFVEVTCSDHRLLHKTTPEEFQHSCDLVATAHARHRDNQITGTMLDNIVKTEGMSYVPGGLSYDPRLRGLGFFEAITVDWMHTWLQDGVFTVEATLMVKAGGAASTPERLLTFLKLPWTFPKNMDTKGKLLWRIFSKHRLDDHGEVDKVRASASELIGLYSLLRHFFATQVDHTPALQPHLDSFQACCAVLDCILAAKKHLVSPREVADTLRAKIASFMRLHLACYGSDYIRPKHGWQWAIPENFDRDDRVWDALIIERLHLLVKETGHRVRGGVIRLEKYLLAGILNSQMGSLRTLHGDCCFVDERSYECDGLPNTRFGRSILVWGMHLHAGDVVFHGRNAAKLCLFAFEDNEFHAIVEVFDEESVVTPSVKIWRVGTGDFRLVRANELDQALYL